MEKEIQFLLFLSTMFSIDEKENFVLSSLNIIFLLIFYDLLLNF